MKYLCLNFIFVICFCVFLRSLLLVMSSAACIGVKQPFSSKYLYLYMPWYYLWGCGYKGRGFRIKVWWRDALFFVYFDILYIHSITLIHYIHLSPFAAVPLHLLIAGQLSGKTLSGVSRRESKSGLPYSKSMHCHCNWYTSHPY